MATTAVFAEILIVGLEAAAWVSLLVLDVFGKGWIDPEKLKGWETLVTLLIIALAYVLGIVIDRVADTIWKQTGRLLVALWRHARGRFFKTGSRLERLWRFLQRRFFRAGSRLERFWRFLKLEPPNTEPEKNKPPYNEMRMTILARGEAALAAFLEYQRSRLRVARGTVLNLFAIIPTGAIYLSDRTDAGAREIAWYVGLTSGALLVTVYATARIKKAGDDRVCDAFKLVQGDSAGDTSDS